MVVISDTSPINDLVLIDEIQILPQLFEKVFVPYAVFQELQEDGTQEKVKDWIASPPSWLELRSASYAKVPFLRNLDLGEREAIQLALELGIQMVLMDDSDGRAEARSFLQMV